MPKIAINRCFGGFGLSDKAFERLIEKGWRVTSFNGDGKIIDDTAELVDMESGPSGVRISNLFPKYTFTSNSDDNELRANSTLVEVIEELGDEASARFSEIEIVEVPDDVEWEITEYDGLEQVEEVHRKWY